MEKFIVGGMKRGNSIGGRLKWNRLQKIKGKGFGYSREWMLEKIKGK